MSDTVFVFNMYGKPHYFEFRDCFGSDIIRYSNVIYFEYDFMYFRLITHDGEVFEGLVSDYCYVGFGLMEDLEMNIHLPDSFHFRCCTTSGILSYERKDDFIEI